MESVTLRYPAGGHVATGVLLDVSVVPPPPPPPELEGKEMVVAEEPPGPVPSLAEVPIGLGSWHAQKRVRSVAAHFHAMPLGCWDTQRRGARPPSPWMTSNSFWDGFNIEDLQRRCTSLYETVA